MSRVDYGQVDIELDGETLTLKPTLAAMQKINKQCGSIRAAITHAYNVDFDVVVAVIAAGAGIGQREAKDLPEKVFAAGVVNLAPAVSEFLGMLMDPSGRDRDESEGGEGKP